MSILVDKNTRVVVQGITGREGSFHTSQMIEYGTNIVAGVTPGKGGGEIHGVPVYDTVEQAVQERDANCSIIFVPAPFAGDAILEAAYSGIELIVTITEGIPVHDMLKVCKIIDSMGVTLIGPNCPGVITPEEVKVGIMPGYIFKKGPVGVVSRSGTLTYQIVDELTQREIGQSTCIGIGGDPIIGTNFIEILEKFENDEETEAVVLIGEIGGSDEENAAKFIQKEMSKPVVAFIAGITAPPEKRMGHAGAIISRGKGDAKSKIAALTDAGIKVGKTPGEVGDLVERLF
jgi:succinyl-CoA synthetase alpha subunit